MTGTIKKAPCDLISQRRRQSSQGEPHTPMSTNSSSMRSTAEFDSDSDEEQFPPPPPSACGNY